MGFENLKFMCGAKYGKNIYASCLEFNGLYEIDSDNGNNKFIGSFPGDSLHCGHLHRNAFVIDNCIYFVPYKATNIHVYDISKGNIYEIKMPRNGYSGGYVGEIFGDKIYMIPESGGSIIELDVYSETTRVVVSEDILTNQIKSVEGENHRFYRICVYNDSIMMPLSNSNVVFEVVILTGKIIRHNLQLDNVWGCFKGKHEIWLLGSNGNKIYSWDVETNAIKDISCYGNYVKSSRCWNWIVDMDENVYVLPAWGKNISVLGKDGFFNLESVDTDDDIYQKFFAPILEENAIYLLPVGLNDMLKIEKKKINRIPIHKMNQTSELYKRICNAYTMNASYELLNENTGFGLEQFIDGLVL